MKKRIILPLVAMLTMSLFAGCSNKDGEKVEPPTGTAQETPAETPAENTDKTPKATGNVSQEELEKIYENNQELRVYVEKFVGKPYQDFKMKNVAGEEFSMKEVANGKNFVIEFMGTWCPVCTEAAPLVDEFNNTNELDVQIYSIAINDTVETLEPYIKDKTTSYFLPTDEDVIEKYSLSFVPIYFFVDSNGIIQLAYSGVVDAKEMTELSKMAFNMK